MAKLRIWWKGRDGVDPRGNPVRIGGWPAVFNPKGNAMTVFGTVHLDNELDYEGYIRSPRWQKHEEGHIVQQKRFGHLVFLVRYAVGAIVGLLRQFGKPRSMHGPWGHDYNPMEIEADEYSDQPDE